MQSAGPVDCDVAPVVVQLGGALHGRARVPGTELVEAVKHRAVVANVKMAETFGETWDENAQS